MSEHTFPCLQDETPIAHIDMDGIEMGILGDGTPYLTVRTLARIAGQRPSALTRLIRGWDAERERPRGRIIRRLLCAQGAADRAYEQLHVHVVVGGARKAVIPDVACMAILEYYAFEAESQTRMLAQQSYRLLARQSLRQFVYGRLGYDRDTLPASAWKHWHDRMVQNPVPAGYFSLLREMTDVLVSAIQSGLAIGPGTQPDVSVGLSWSKFWLASDLDAIYGERRKHPHRVPGTSEHVIEAWIYPVAALGAFRTWLREAYLSGPFPRYLAMKARQGAFPPHRARRLLAALEAGDALA